MVDLKRGLRNPAGLSALAAGDVENFLVAATPGGIEAQEARGQADLTRKFTQLPKDGLDRYRENLEHLGFKIGEDADDIFVGVTSPTGWELRPSDHSMWSYIHDDQGRRRGAVFYKAAFYDRSAHFSLQPRYQAGGDYRGEERYSAAKDTATGAVLFELGPQDRKNYKQSEDDDRATFKYLDEHFPDWKNVEAYW
jgi:hypothetical protein